MKQVYSCQLFAIALTLCSFLISPAQQIHSGNQPQTKIIPASKSLTVDNGYPDQWYSQAVAGLQKLEYDFHTLPANGAFKVLNPKNHITAVISHDRYTIWNSVSSSTDEQWTAGLFIKGIGRNNSFTALEKEFTVSKTDGFISYTSGNTVIEYLNSEQGLRQNFIINKKPAGKGPLKISMEVTGNLSASVSDNKLRFFEKGDSEVKLVYADLKVWDANHKTLPAFMQYDAAKKELNIVVDDAEAVFPVLVDPINQTPEWSSSADGILSSLLSNTQLTTALYGFTVASLGDVNGDGYGDVAISAPAIADVFSGTGTLAAVGAVFVYYGSATGLPDAPDKILQPNTAVAGALFGFSVAGGDVTGDGKNDIIIGAPLDKFDVQVGTALIHEDVTVTAGKVYIYRGEDLSSPIPSPFLHVKLSNSFFSNGVAGLLGSNVNVTPLFGFSVAATDDLNSDGKADLLIGAPSYVGTSLLSTQTGAAFVYYSNALNDEPVSLQTPSAALLGLIELPVGSSSSLLFGYSVDGMGDYNTDGYPDIVVGAPAGVDLSSLGGIFSGQVLGGSAYIYYGSSAGIKSSIGAKLQASAGSLLGNAANLFGYKVTGLKNVNGLHNGNVLISAPLGGTLKNALGLTIQTGNVHVFLKQTSSPSAVVTANQVIESPRSSGVLQLLSTLGLNVLYGVSTDNAYDINCDSYPDIVVGEPLSSGTNLLQLDVNAVGGSIYVYYGTAAGTFNPTPMYTASATYGNDILSINGTALFGFSVAGAPKVKGTGSTPRIIAGSPSGSLDFGNSLLNLGSTLDILFNFVAGNNGPGKAYGFNTGLCGSSHALPVRSISLNAQKQESSVQLNWLATEEKNVNQYVVEKSTDGISFSPIAYVFAQNKEGKNNYSLTDRQPSALNFYRLRIIDNDNSFIYSSTLKIKFDVQSLNEISIAPNPVSGNSYKLKLTGLEKGIYTVEIRNTNGQLLQKGTVNVNEYSHTETMARNNTMATGMYYLNVYNKNAQPVKTIKFLIH